MSNLIPYLVVSLAVLMVGCSAVKGQTERADAPDASHFQFRLVSSLSALYPNPNNRRDDKQGGGYWFSDWLSAVDSNKPPYVHREVFEQNLKDYAVFCKLMHERGFNAINMADVIHLVTFDKLEKDNPYAIFSADSPMRKRHEIWREYFRKFIQISHDNGLKFIMFSDEFVYTPEMEKWVTANGMPISTDNPRLWEIYREKYRELFRIFPEIDGVILRVGEIYLSSGYQGKAIASVDGTETAKYHKLVQETYDVVCKECNKIYIHRTWNMRAEGLHSRPDLYHQIFDDIPSKNLYVSIKHTMTDFWYYEPMNPTIGIPGHQQIIEVQARSEFDGQGVTPCIKVFDIQSRLQRAEKMDSAVGVFVWPGEGGIDNSKNHAGYETMPYFGKSGFWNEASTYFVSEMARNPNRDARTVLKEWAAGKFGPRAADTVADMLMLSDEATKHVWYINSYAEQTIWHPSPMYWFRISNRGWATYRPKLSNWQFDKMLEDDTVGTTLTRRMVERFEAARDQFDDPKLYEAALDSLKHFDTMANLLSSWHRAKLFAFQIAVGGTGDGREPLQPRLDRELDNLDQAVPAYEKNYGFWNLDEVKVSMKHLRAGEDDPDVDKK